MKTEDIDKRIGMPDVDAEWEKFEREVIDKETTSNKSIFMWGLSIAASIALLAGIFLFGNASQEQEEIKVAKVEQPAAQQSHEEIATTPETEKAQEKEIVPETRIALVKDIASETKTASETKIVSEPVQRPAPELLAKETPSNTEEKKEDKGNKAVEEPVKQEKIFSVVEQNPSFPGGYRALEDFIKTNKKYPELAQEYGAKGRVITSFLVDSLGYVSDFKIHKCILQYDSLRLSQETEERQEQVKEQIIQQLGEESKRILSLMPRWAPGKMYGKVRSVRYNLPVQFP